jgi:hypothetical protein
MNADKLCGGDVLGNAYAVLKASTKINCGAGQQIDESM